jgi:hypothetical protein
VDLCGASALGEATVFMRATVLEMIFVGATALKATVPIQIYRIIGAMVLEATVIVRATVLGGESVSGMD